LYQIHESYKKLTTRNTVYQIQVDAIIFMVFSELYMDVILYKYIYIKKIIALISHIYI
jgi:hypothetical protein